MAPQNGPPAGFIGSGPPAGLQAGQGMPDFSAIDYSVTGLAADRAPIVIGVVSTLYALTVVAISLRMISKWLSRGKYWWDDYLAVAAWMFYSVKAAATLYMASPAVGGARHFWLVSLPQVIEFLKWQQITFMIYPLGMGCAKLSLLLLYIKIFGNAKWFRYWCYVLMGIVVSWVISTFFVTLFMCLPFGTSWNILDPRRQCVDQETFFVDTAIIDAVLNFLILVAPVYSIWKLKLSTKKKIAISGVLSLGAGELIFTILRIAMWTALEMRDIPWDFFPITIWSNVQEAVGIVCICLPALGPLINARARKGTKKYDYSAKSEESKRTGGKTGLKSSTKSMGTVTLCQSVFDEKDDLPLKGTIKRTDSSEVSSSFLMDEDQVSI